MKTTLLAAGIAATLFIAGPVLAKDKKKDKDSDAGQSKMAPIEIITPKEKITLFNGKNLDGLYTFIRGIGYDDPNDVFSVTDEGLLRVSGDGYGAVITNDGYKDYHLVLEYRWGDQTWHGRKNKTKDSGMLIHSVGPDGGYHGTWMPSIEVQIIEGGVGDFILVVPDDPEDVPVPFSLTCEVAKDRDGEIIWKKGGEKLTINQKKRRRINWSGRDPDWKDVLGYRGDHDPDSAGHGWTRIDVFAEGDTIRTFVNGVPVNAAIACSPSQGQLQLQTELAELFVRRWELYPIGEGPKPAKAE